MCAQTQPYYIGRIDKIDKKIIKDSILCNTWIYDRNYELCKAHDTVQENILWTLYNSDRSSIENRELLYNGYVWYAAYLAYFKYMENTDKSITFDDILSVCLEILLRCIEKYDIKYEHHYGVPTASFYTYYGNAVHKELHFVLAQLKCECLTKSIFYRFSSISSLAHYYDEEVSDIIKMSEEEYLSKYGKKFSKKNFIKLYNFINSSYSLDDDTAFDEVINSSTDTQIKLREECSKLNKYDDIDKICDEMFIKEMYCKIVSFMMKNSKSKNKKRQRNTVILYKYLMGYNYSEISEILQLGLARQRIHQIVSKEIKNIRENLNNIFTDDEIKEIKSFL